MTEFDDQLKAGMRRLVAEKGRKVNFSERAWEEVSVYGWADYDAVEHTASYGDNCEWVVPEGTKVTEKTYSMFMGTWSDNEDEVGINAEGVSCKCGKYKDVTIRATCSLGEAIRSLIGYDSTREMRL